MRRENKVFSSSVFYAVVCLDQSSQSCCLHNVSKKGKNSPFHALLAHESTHCSASTVQIRARKQNLITLPVEERSVDL